MAFSVLNTALGLLFFIRFCFWLPVCHFCNGLLNDFFFRKVAFIMVVERALGWDLGELGYGLAGSVLGRAVWFGGNYLPCLRLGIEREFFSLFFFGLFVLAVVCKLQSSVPKIMFYESALCERDESGSSLLDGKAGRPSSSASSPTGPWTSLKAARGSRERSVKPPGRWEQPFSYSFLWFQISMTFVPLHTFQPR